MQLRTTTREQLKFWEEGEPSDYTYSQKYDRLDMPSTEFHDTRSGFESLQFWQLTNVMPLRRFDRNNSLPFDYGHPFLNSP